jgi:hypothetical protein
MSKYIVEYVLNLKDRISGQLKGIQGGVGRLDKAFGGIGKTLGAFGLAFGAFELIKSALAAALDVEEVDKRLIESAERLAGANHEQAQSLIDLASATQWRSRFGDEDIKRQQTALLQYGLTVKEVKKLTPVIADFAAATGQDMAGATQKVIQGLNGMARGLKVHGIELEAGGSKAENMTQIMGQLNEKFGGSAAKDIETTAGRVEVLKNSFGDLLETIGTVAVQGEGGGIVGFLNDTAIGLDELVKWVSGSQSMMTSDVNAATRTYTKNIDEQKLANDKLSESFLTNNQGIDGYLMLINEASTRQAQFGQSISDMSSRGIGYINEDFSNTVIQMQAVKATQTELIESTKQYVVGLDSVGQNQAFQKIANQMGVATEQVRQFFGELGKGDTPIQKTLETVADFEEEITRLKTAQKDVKDSATFNKLGKQIKDNEDKMARITGKGTGTGGGSRAGAGATSSTLTSRSPQTFNINITKLVETINTTKPQLNTTDSQTMRQITEALVMAVNDVQTTVQ